MSVRRLLLNLQNSFKKLEVCVMEQASRLLAGMVRAAAAAFWRNVGNGLEILLKAGKHTLTFKLAG